MTRLTVAVVSGLLLLGVPAAAQQAAAPAVPKMAFIDLQRVAGESAEGKIATGRVQALNQKKVGELAEKQKQLQASQQKLQGAAVLSEAARAQAQKDIDRLTVEIERFQQDASAEVTELQQQLLGEFQEKLQPVITALVKELGIGIVFSAGDAGTIYLDPSLDITGEVIKRFNMAMAAAAAKPAAAAPAPAPTAKPAPAAPAPAAPAPPAAPVPPKP